MIAGRELSRRARKAHKAASRPWRLMAALIIGYLALAALMAAWAFGAAQ